MDITRIFQVGYGYYPNPTCIKKKKKKKQKKNKNPKPLLPCVKVLRKRSGVKGLLRIEIGNTKDKCIDMDAFSSIV